MNDLALTTAAAALGGGGKHAHGGLAAHLHRAGTVAVGADLGSGSLGAAAAVAGTALLHTLHAYFLLAAEGRFFEADGQVQANAFAPLRRVGIGSPAAAEAAAEKAAENVAQIAEVEVAVEAAAKTASAEIGIHTGVAILIVTGLLITVRQHFICLVDFLELLFCLFIVGIQVRMVLPCLLLICFFDLVLACPFGDTQDLVVITLVCHIYSSS